MKHLALALLLFTQADQYHGLVRSDGLNCCGGDDCRALAPGELRETDKGFEVLYKGEWLIAPSIAILKNESWDGRNHACIGDYGQSAADAYVRCLVVDTRV